MNAPNPEISEDWFETWFRSEYYLKLYAHRDRTEAELGIDLILRSAGLQRATDGTALDLACGPGRHAIALARRGLSVTAVDLSPTLLTYAHADAVKEGVADQIRFHQTDMRAIDYHDQFDLAVQLFTSFGYFDSPAEDFLVLERVRTALHNGGCYALDLINPAHLRLSIVEESTRCVDGLSVWEEREIVGDRVRKRITISVEGVEHEFIESVRLYSPDMIDEMLRQAGFIPKFWFGDYHGGEYDWEKSVRMLVVSSAV